MELLMKLLNIKFIIALSPSCVLLFVTPWTAARQASHNGCVCVCVCVCKDTTNIKINIISQ